MKKFIALLMVGGLLLTGCGQQASAPEKEDVTAVVEETPTEEVEEVVSDSAMEATDDATDDVSAETDEVETDEVASLENPSGLNIITTHDATDPAADNSTEYFPEVTELFDIETTLDNIFPSTFNFKNYEYSIEHRRLDFLESGDDVTYNNFINTGDYIVNEYLTKNNIPETEFTVGDVIQSNMIYYRAYINKQPEIDYTKDYTDAELQDLLNINYTLVYIMRTIDDPNNGVSVLIIKDVPNNEVPV